MRIADCLCGLKCALAFDVVGDDEHQIWGISAYRFHGRVAHTNTSGPAVYLAIEKSEGAPPNAVFVGWEQKVTRKTMVGERGFEPPTPWSRTRFRSLLKLV